MATFMLLWNPTKWAWAEFESGQVAAKLSATGGFDEPWTTGTRHQGITPGDRIFLLKTGTEPRGIIAAGRATNPVHEAIHWDHEHPRLAPQVDVMWTEIADLTNPLAYGDVLGKTSGLPPRLMGGGLLLDEDDAAALEDLWRERLTVGGDGTSVTLHGTTTTRRDVLRVLREYDALGQAQFLQKHRFKPSRRYWLEHRGVLYESKAVLGVAAGLTSLDFSGGRETTSRLERLGFVIRELGSGPAGDYGAMTRPSFSERDASVQVAPPGPAEDPDTSGRGLRSHRELENWLAERIRAAGHEPRDHSPLDPPFDLAWEDADGLHVVEVKSITSGNEISQMRCGLGQVLEYAQLLRTHEKVHPILFLEREPTGPHWSATCRSAGVELWWPSNLSL